MQQWYTMQDVADSVQPYKVFTALVRQQGNNSFGNIGGGDLIVGKTYNIAGPGGDFTNVGAPNNDIGTSFIATGTTPASWNGATLNYNDGAPTATILENTIGNIWFEYSAAGIYNIKSDNLFILNKTFINGASLTNYSVFNQFVGISGGSNPGFRGYFFNQDAPDAVILNTLKNAGSFEDDIINDPICIEIRVYN
jgi:hypothetical protein